MIWPIQYPDLTTIELVSNELDIRVNKDYPNVRREGERGRERDKQRQRQRDRERTF